MTGPLVVGLDLSLTCTGAVSSTGRVTRLTSKGGAEDSLRMRSLRLSKLADQVLATVMADGLPYLVVMEGPSFGSVGGHHHDRSGFAWLVLERLHNYAGSGLPVAEMVPAALKKYATGRGNAGKDEVLAAVVRRFPDIDVLDNNTADATVLMAAGRDHLGHPLVEVPAAHRAVLANVAWPTSIRSVA